MKVEKKNANEVYEELKLNMEEKRNQIELLNNKNVFVLIIYRKI